jgi:hypothetical protein
MSMNVGTSSDSTGCLFMETTYIIDFMRLAERPSADQATVSLSCHLIIVSPTVGDATNLDATCKCKPAHPSLERGVSVFFGCDRRIEIALVSITVSSGVP